MIHHLFHQTASWTYSMYVYIEKKRPHFFFKPARKNSNDMIAYMHCHPLIQKKIEDLYMVACPDHRNDCISLFTDFPQYVIDQEDVFRYDAEQKTFQKLPHATAQDYSHLPFPKHNQFDDLEL